MSGGNSSATSAGLGLQVGGVAIQLFEVVQKGFETYTRAMAFDETSAILQAKLVIEEARFARWGEALGLIRSYPFPGATQPLDTATILQKTPLSAATVNLLVSAVQVLLSDFGTLKSRYGIQASGGGAAAAPGALPPPATNPNLSSPPANAAGIDTWIRHIQGLIPDRMGVRWAISGQDQFVQLIQDLKDINDGLLGLLPLPFEKDVARAVVAELTSTDEWKALHDLALAAKAQNTGIWAAASCKQSVIQAASPSLSRIGGADLLVEPSLVTPDTGTQETTTGTYASASGEIRVLLEWKRYKGNLPNEPEKFRRASARVENIAQALHQQPKPEDFRILKCLKYFDDLQNNRFGFVFQTPAESDPLAKPVSLLSLYRSRKPLLGEKFSLASVIANCVYEFHCTNWFHKSICPQNILFFPAKGGDISLRAPFLTGFEFSRLVYEEQDSEPPDSDYLYCHPDYKPPAERGGSTDIRYRREYDLYALGLVLFEIGAWRELKDFQSKGHRVELRQKLLDNYLPKLGGTMGAIYRDAVRACLSGHFETPDGETPVSKEEFLRMFRWGVVKELELCNA